MWMDNWVLNLPVTLWPKYTQKHTPFLFRFFETKKTVVVLSSSNQPEIEINQAECLKHNIPVLRRKGGGGTVVLGSGCLILTFAFYAKDLFANKKYFQMINELWINALKENGYDSFSQQGISDICHHEKKVAGTSIFRKKHLLVYQGSLLVDPDIDFISKLLAHPSREPAYRMGRSHKDFMTTLNRTENIRSFPESTQTLGEHCQKYFAQHVGEYFKEECL